MATSPVKRPRLDAVSNSSSNEQWVEVIATLKPAIVALKVTNVRAFEEDPAATALGTGFVVDQQRGIILTNRHITGVGPVRATAIFDKHEELEVQVLYRDPIHDFGFFQYDPAKLRLTRQAQVVLDPDGLKVGAAILVVGNDAGEKLQILSGTIARIDRNVPEFSSVYNDENTFYAGAGAGTSGGSSGSPVLNKEGRAIALNAAGQEGTNSSYFLPLDRVVYSLERLQQRLPVQRGTCLAALLFKPFDELIRVGLRREHEDEVRRNFEEATGMLIVESVLRDQELLRPGDILLKVEGEVCISFVKFEAALDARVGSSVTLLICRAGEVFELMVPVRDLHALIPTRFVEMGLDILHEIGYHAAKRVNLPLDSGLYLARSGLIFNSLDCGRMSLVTVVAGKPVPTLEAFAEAVKGIASRQYFPVSWYELPDFRRDRMLKTGFAKMSQSWPRLRQWVRKGANGEPENWVPTDLSVAPPQVPSQSSSVIGPGSVAMFTGGDPLIRKLQASLVTVRFHTDRRFITEGPYNGSSDGTGVLVDAEQGLVLTDRHSVPQSLGDVEVKLAGSMTLDAEVVFIHPLHNLAIVRYDADAARKAKLPLKAATLAQGPKATLRPGEVVYFVGFDGQGNTFTAEVRVAAVYLPSGRDEFPMWDMPRFRQRNLEIVVLADTPEDARGGILCDANGAIRAFYAAFDWQDQAHHHQQTTEAFGIPVAVFKPIVEAARQSRSSPLTVPSLDIEVVAIDVSTLARGTTGQLPLEWVQAVGRSCSSQGRVPRALKIGKVFPFGASHDRLMPGDVLLSVDGRTVVSCIDLESTLRDMSMESRCASKSSREVRKRPASVVFSAEKSTAPTPNSVNIKVLRGGVEVSLEVVPALLGSEDADHLVLWSGIVLRKTPRSALESCGENAARVASNVFAQAVLGGSPADARDFGFLTHWFLLDVDGCPIKSLEDLLKVLKSASAAHVESEGVQHRRWTRIRLVDMDGREHVKAVQCDPVFWPTLEMRRDEKGHWQSIEH